jgi:hypothetical protein
MLGLVSGGRRGRPPGEERRGGKREVHADRDVHPGVRAATACQRGREFGSSGYIAPRRGRRVARKRASVHEGLQMRVRHCNEVAGAARLWGCRPAPPNTAPATPRAHDVLASAKPTSGRGGPQGARAHLQRPRCIPQPSYLGKSLRAGRIVSVPAFRCGIRWRWGVEHFVPAQVAHAAR